MTVRPAIGVGVPALIELGAAGHMRHPHHRLERAVPVVHVRGEPVVQREVQVGQDLEAQAPRDRQQRWPDP
ncbi:MAG: hypothetical protein R2939_11615 [Kofleriaceae bacterium]